MYDGIWNQLTEQFLLNGNFYSSNVREDIALCLKARCHVPLVFNYNYFKYTFINLYEHNCV